MTSGTPHRDTFDRRALRRESLVNRTFSAVMLAAQPGERGLAVLGLLVSLLLASAGPSTAWGLGGNVVTNANDSGPGSLRAAMLAHAPLIEFSPAYFATPRTILLQSPLPSIDGDTAIIGPGADRLRIDGQFRSNPAPLIGIYGNPTVRLEGFTLTGGWDPLSTGDVGGIFTRGNLTLAKMHIAGNRGTGIFNQGGNLTIVESSITGQTEEGLFNQVGVATIINSTVAENVGGVFNQVGNLSVLNSTIANNQGYGISSNFGSLSTDFQPGLRLVSSILANNANADLYANAITAITNCLVEHTSAPISGAGNLVGVDPALTAMGLHGGTTPSFRPALGSAAINAGSNPLSLAVDQRGAARVFGGRIDMGAVEAVPEPGTLAALGALAGCSGPLLRRRGSLSLRDVRGW
jgi:hypothetical protein